ncbi:AraC family transcriptional regulator [Leifsonia sp. C5G2]|uniref:AraC family transcriptional regulator n=1 Tax=Leifsonia sp. C5G2 TaxID=2735269 RepID=UPI0015853D47|nr:AraC family transcriptional regulator [Leifsonia sp. C5G2]NUU06168.1 AraC family transcriptional regulator [Leifsonia sp. C5G2]
MTTIVNEDAVRDGFPGQRMLVLPRPLVREALSRPGTRSVLVTDCGYFPEAHHHGRERRTPIPQTVILICVKGRGWCATDAGTFEVLPGQAVILPPNKPHSYGAQEDDPWTLWWLHIDGENLADVLPAYGMTDGVPVRSVSDMYAVVSLASQVIQWMERDTTNTSLLAAGGAAWYLLTTLAGDRGPGEGAEHAVARAASYLRDNAQARVSVADLAAMAGLSTSHFAALFRKHTGVAVLQYQTQLRMAKARELLDTTDRPIAQIAENVGYDDSFYFARQFRRIHGVSPSSYRRHDKG